MFADELDIHLLPKVGYQWMPKGEVVEVVTPGVNQKRYLAAALDHLTGRVVSCIGERKTSLLFLELLIERVFWELHDKWTRNHRRKQICQLVDDVERHPEVNGPWPYKLSAIYYTAEVTAAVKELEKQQLSKAA